MIYRVDLSNVDTRARVQFFGLVHRYNAYRIFLHLVLTGKSRWNHITSVRYGMDRLINSGFGSTPAAVSGNWTESRVNGNGQATKIEGMTDQQ